MPAYRLKPYEQSLEKGERDALKWKNQFLEDTKRF